MIPLACGREADVFALDEDRVLRRYRRPRDASIEAAAMRSVAAQGFPVPEVHSAEGRDLVMQRLHGPTLLAAMATGSVPFDDAAKLLVDLHHRLGPTGFVHLDLHPDNVVLTDAGPVVIDWSNVRPGPAHLDLAMTCVILAQIAVDATHPLAAEAGTFLALFQAHLTTADPLRLLPDALALRAADPGMTTAETALLPRAEALIRGCKSST